MISPQSSRDIICAECPDIYSESDITATHNNESRPLVDVLGRTEPDPQVNAEAQKTRATRRLFGRESHLNAADSGTLPDIANLQREKLSNLNHLKDWTFTCPRGHIVDGNRGYQIPLAVVGPSGSSKSHFLPGLIWETNLLRMLSPLGVTLRQGPFTSSQLSYSVRQLYEEKKTLPPTPPNKVDGPYGYRLTIREAGEDTRYSLLLFDVGGEALSSIVRIAEQAAFVLLARALIVLIDPQYVVPTLFDEANVGTTERERLIAAARVADSITLVADTLEELWDQPMKQIPIPTCFLIAKADSLAWAYDWASETEKVVTAAQKGESLTTALSESSERARSAFADFGGAHILEEIEEHFAESRTRFVAASATSEMPVDNGWVNPTPAGISLALLQILDMLGIVGTNREIPSTPIQPTSGRPIRARRPPVPPPTPAIRPAAAIKSELKEARPIPSSKAAPTIDSSAPVDATAINTAVQIAATPLAPKAPPGLVAGNPVVDAALTPAADSRGTASQVRDDRPPPTADPESGAGAKSPRERRPQRIKRRRAAVATGMVIAVITLLTALVFASAPQRARRVVSPQREDSRPTASAKPTANATALTTRPHVRWAARTGGPVESRPAVVGGTVYFGSRDHKVYALDATTGNRRWAYTTGDAIRSSPTVVGGIVYIGSSDHKVYALDASTGHPRWTYTTGNKVNCSPTVVGGTVYVGSSDHKVYALDAITGHLRWTYTTGSFIFTRPAVADGTVYTGSWDHKVYALDATTGHLRWTYTTSGPIFSSPAVADGTVYIGSRDAHVYALDATTGHLRWTYTTRGPVPATPAVADGTVYVDSKDGRVYALDATTGHLRWAHTTRTSNASSSPVVAGNTVYVGSSDHKIYALAAASGHLRWAHATGDGSLQRLVVADGTLYIGSTDHNLYAVSVGSGQTG